jgi:hypothetical protein
MGGYWSKPLNMHELWTNINIANENVYTIYPGSIDSLLFDQSNIYFIKHNETEDCVIMIRYNAGIYIAKIDSWKINVAICNDFISSLITSVNSYKFTFTVRSSHIDQQRLDKMTTCETSDLYKWG